MRAKVVDPATRNVLPVGARGELAVSGYLVMRGYWGDEARTRDALVQMEDGEAEDAAADAEDATAAAQSGGGGSSGSGGAVTARTWMLTGDEASMDADGYVRITGRIKDLIIRGGENVHPLEIEDCLLQMDAVADASVVGVADERYGEAVGAFVVRAAAGGGDVDADRIRAWVRTRLSRHLVPRHVFFVDSLPKTASGKVQKFVLRDRANALVKEGRPDDASVKEDRADNGI